MLACALSWQASAVEHASGQLNANTIAGRSIQPPSPGSSQQKMMQRLLSIEQRLLPPTVIDGPNTHSTLPDYYWAANEELLSRFAEVNQRYVNRSPRPMRAITLVAGPAGIGKTFLKSQVTPQTPDAPRCHRCDIRELYDAWSEVGLVEQCPDLAAGNSVINYMPRMRDRQSSLIKTYFANQDADCFVLDSLDEVHTCDYRWILNEVADFVENSGRPFIHVSVFGRGFAFRDYWRERTDASNAVDIELHVLHPPRFVTTGDLQVSSWNYYTWANQLSWSIEREAERPLSLEEYRAWEAAGFSRQGKFANVTVSPPDAVSPQVHATFVGWANKHRFVSDTLGNLAGNGIMRELADRFAGSPYDEPQLMRAYLAQQMIRESSVDGRPSEARPQSAALYQRLLEMAAAHVLERDKVGDDGSFEVSRSETIGISVAGELQQFPTTVILEHSGLTWNDPLAQSEEAIFRFEPIWFHRLLFEMHLERNGSASKRNSLSARSGR